MSESIVYDGRKYNLEQVQELSEQGVKFLCPRCGSELIVALTKKAAEQQGVHPGMVCPVNENHLLVLVELAEIREQMWSVIKPYDTSPNDLDELWS